MSCTWAKYTSESRDANNLRWSTLRFNLFWNFEMRSRIVLHQLGVVECCTFSVSMRSKLELLPHPVVISSSFCRNIGFQWRSRYQIPFICVKVLVRPTPCDFLLWHCCCDFFNLLRSKLHKCCTNVLIQIPNFGCACRILEITFFVSAISKTNQRRVLYFVHQVPNHSGRATTKKYVGVIRSVFHVSPTSTDGIYTTRHVLH